MTQAECAALATAAGATGLEARDELGFWAGCLRRPFGESVVLERKKNCQPEMRSFKVERVRRQDDVAVLISYTDYELQNSGTPALDEVIMTQAECETALTALGESETLPVRMLELPLQRVATSTADMPI